MRKLRILGAVALAVLMTAPDALAQRRGGGGGAARSGMRGAMVGGMAGGSEGAKKGAKAGVAVGVTRNVAEGQPIAAPWIRNLSRVPNTSRATSIRMLSTRISMKRRRKCSSLLNRMKRQLKAERPSFEKDGKPIVGITYPSTLETEGGEKLRDCHQPKGKCLVGDRHAR